MHSVASSVFVHLTKVPLLSTFTIFVVEGNLGPNTVILRPLCVNCWWRLCARAYRDHRQQPPRPAGRPGGDGGLYEGAGAPRFQRRWEAGIVKCSDI